MSQNPRIYPDFPRFALDFSRFSPAFHPPRPRHAPVGDDQPGGLGTSRRQRGGGEARGVGAAECAGTDLGKLNRSD